MRKISIILLSYFLIQTSFGYESSKLRVQLTGDIKSSSYVCIGSAGCLNIAMAKQERNVHIAPGEITQIYLVDNKTDRVYPQTLPSSCNITLDRDRTLVIRGNIETRANNTTIKNFGCYVERN